jgi:hypothetical protein
MARLDWDKAAAQGRVRSSGGEPAWFGLPLPASLKQKTKTSKRSKRQPKRPLRSPQSLSAAHAMCVRVDAIVADFELLSPWEKAATVRSCQERIRRICSDERRMPDGSEESLSVIRAATRDLVRRRSALAPLDDDA